MRGTSKVLAVALSVFAPCAWCSEAKPEMISVRELSGDKGNKVFLFKHRATAGMDSPGYIASAYEHHVSFGLPAGFDPEARKSYPLLVWLHGFGDKPDACADAMVRWFADRDAFILGPNDSLGTWFYGYSDQLPNGDPNRGKVVNYTERRILFYLEHFQARYPIDGNRVYLTGGSMGGTGAVSLALRYPHIFAGADAKKGATNRLYCHWKGQCERIWGRPESGVKNDQGANVWDWQNMAWYAAGHHKNATWIRALNGREDTSIPYRQLAGPPGVKPMSFYRAMEAFKIGHQCLWDCSSHGAQAKERVALDDWWEPFFDRDCHLRLDRSFPAFCNFSANDDPGTGAGDAVGPDSQLGDNTYDGDPNGGLNRFLRWNSNTITDEPGSYSIEIAMSARANGYKGGGEETVDVTPRRLQKFVVRPGMEFSWSTSLGQSGKAVADGEGLLTIPAVRVTTSWTRLGVKPSR